MGAGHFLVSLVDYLTDRVIEALAEAHKIAPDYESPVAARIERIRETIQRNATTGGWTVAPSQLDDRHLVRTRWPISDPAAVNGLDHPVNRCTQPRKVPFDNTPDDLTVDPKLFVHDHVAKASDSAPREIGLRRLHTVA